MTAKMDFLAETKKITEQQNVVKLKQQEDNTEKRANELAEERRLELIKKAEENAKAEQLRQSRAEEQAIYVNKLRSQSSEQQVKALVNKKLQEEAVCQQAISLGEKYENLKQKRAMNQVSQEDYLSQLNQLVTEARQL